MEIRLPNNWQPRPCQQKLWNYLELGGKRAIEIAHRRFGKDDIALHRAAVAMHERVGNYWHMLPEYNQARKAIWEAINPRTGIRRIDEAFPDTLFDKRGQDMFIRSKMNGSTWQLIGSDNYNALVGSPPIGLTASEWALADPAAWAYLSPILEDNGGWALFITTPRGKNHAYRMLRAAQKNPLWFAEVSPAPSTGIFTEDQLENIRHDLRAQFGDGLGESYYRQEYLCSFDAAIMGSVYGEWMDKAEREERITPMVKHDPAYPVYTSWDLGFTDATSIWFYQIGVGEILLIDYYENAGHGIGHYCDMLKGKIDGYERMGHYRYHRHFAPEDANYKVQAAGGRSIAEQAMKDHGVRLEVIPETGHANEIAATRKTIPRCWFNAEQCDKGIEALRSYHFKYNEELKILSEKPVHDWSSHASRSFGLLARVWQENALSQKELETQAKREKFQRLRRENNLEQYDPYRLKPVRR